MNPYVQFGLAMCLVVGISLAGTAFLAATFNRKAKADMTQRLAPLAEAINGTADIDEALVEGRFGDQLAFGRAENAPGGFGRLFHVELVDSAGGERWEWSHLPVKKEPIPKRVFEGGPDLEARLNLDWDALSAVVPDAANQRYGFIYDPDQGLVRLTREMRGRVDIPGAELFIAQLTTLKAIGDANRRAQSEVGPSASAIPPGFDGRDHQTVAETTASDQPGVRQHSRDHVTGSRAGEPETIPDEPSRTVPNG